MLLDSGDDPDVGLKKDRAGQALHDSSDRLVKLYIFLDNDSEEPLHGEICKIYHHKSTSHGSRIYKNHSFSFLHS